MKENQAKPNKHPYRKPQVEKVRLVTEEAVLAACKALHTSSGPTGSNCKHAGTPCPTAVS